MDFEQISKQIRKDTVSCIGSIGVGHIGGSLSIVDLLTVLYYKHMNIDPKNPKMEGRDRLIVSKGHAGPAVYATLANKGYFAKELLLTLNQGGTTLPSHCDMNLTPGIDMTAGSLGQGFSCAVGVALGSKLKNDGAYTYAIIGDGESQEGQIWEAAMAAKQLKLNRLIAFTDFNRMQIDGNIEDVCELDPLDKKWESFGWNTIVLEDGNDCNAIDKAIEEAKKCQDKPTMVILKTIKGKGVKFVEDKKSGCHSMTITQEDVQKAYEEIERA